MNNQTNKSLFIAAISLLFILSFAFADSSYAQNKSGAVLNELQQKNTVPRQTKPQSAPVIKNEISTAPSTAQTKKILIKKIHVIGVTILKKQTIKSIILPYEGKKLSIAGISRIAEKITAKYRKEGYIIAYAYVPVQDIKDGMLTIKVIEGKVGNITVSGNKHYSANFIKKYLEKVKSTPSLKEQTLERALLLLNDNLALKVKASIKAGKKPETADIAAYVKDSYPLSFGLSYDNFGSKSTSKNRATVWLNKGSLITDGDLVSLRGTTGLDRLNLNRLAYGRVEYSLPIGYSGTRIGAYYTNAVYKAGEQFAVLNIHGKSNIAGIYLTYPLIKQINTTLLFKIGFDYKDITDYMLGSTGSKDKIREAHIGITGIFSDPLRGRNVIDLTYYRGISGIFGGTGAGDTNVSTVGAKGNFNKLTANIERTQPITNNTYFRLSASGQLAGSPLFSAEQFFVGGMGTVPGFDASYANGDSGYTVSGELFFPPPFPDTIIGQHKLGKMMKLVLFADYGQTHKKEAQPGEQENNYLTSIGTGLRIFAGKHFFVRLNWGIPKINGSFKTKNSKVYLQTSLFF